MKLTGCFLFLILAFVFLIGEPLLAQNPVVSGRVTDSSDAVIPGATVTLTARATGMKATTLTNEEGYFVLPPVAPGAYEASAAMQGFSVSRVESLTLEVGQSRTLNFKLQIGELQQSVTVTDTAPLLTVNRADRGAVVENKFVASIPLNTRNPLFLLTMAPGIVAYRGAGDNILSQNQTGGFRINGGRSAMNEFLLDGAANTGTYNNMLSAIPQIDAVQEFKVATSPYAAEFGRTGGGVVSYSIKSGTNDFHATVHEFLRNSVLDATGFNTNRAGQTKSSFKRNQFGFTAGGPVYLPRLYNGKNRTFWFAAYEGLRERSFYPFTGTLPTSREKQGDFSQSLDTNGALLRIYDPATTRLDPNRPAGTTRYIRDLFPNNTVPSNRINPVALNILKYYPSPNQAGSGLSNTNNFFIAGARSLDANRVDLRIDHQLTEKHMLFFRYDWFSNRNAQPLLYGNFASPIETPNRIPGINWTVNHTWTLSSRNILEHHFSMAESGTNRIPLSMGFDLTSLGFPKSMADGIRIQYFPQITISGLSQLGPTGTAYNQVVSRTWQYALALTSLRGSHTFKAGVDYRRFPVSIDQQSPLQMSSSGSFTAGPNPQAATSGTGRGLADLLLGVSSVTYNHRPLERHEHPYYAFYFQDEYRITSKLTLTMGLRYSLELPRTEFENKYVFLDTVSASPIQGKVPGISTIVGGVGFVGVSGLGRRTQRADTNNWDPRLGLAWAMNSKTVVRSGVGLFRHPIVPNTDSSLGFARATTSIFAQPDGVTPLYNLSNPFPNGFQQPTGNSLGLSTNLGQAINGPLRQQRLGYSTNWSLDVQRQLPLAVTVDLGYSGAASVALPLTIQYNQLTPAQLKEGTALNATVTNPFYGVITDPTSTLGRTTIQKGLLLKPYPQFTSFSGNQVPNGHAIYHAFQFKAERRFSQGLAVLFAYTHSKTIDNVGDSNWQQGPPATPNIYCFSCERALSVLDIADVVRFSYRYDLPLGKSRRWLQSGPLAHIIGGWAVAGMYTWDNGLPISVSGPNDSNSFGGSQRPDGTGQKSRLDASRKYVDGAPYFNAAAFSRAPQFTFGTASRTVPDVRAPGTVNWDVLIEKRFRFTERIGMEFRAELYNALNQVIFAGPTTLITSADFGKIRLNQVNTPRQVQFGMRLTF